MTEPEKTQTKTTRLHMHDHHANSQLKVKVKIVERNEKSITILWLRTAINFLFPFLLAFYVEKQIINFQKRFVVCSVSRKSILLR